VSTCTHFPTVRVRVTITVSHYTPAVHMGPKLGRLASIILISLPHKLTGLHRSEHA
jgi:hypothetical protein